MLKAKVEWLEVRLGLRVTKRLLDKNRDETLDDDGKSLKQERRLASIPRCRTQPPTQIAQKVTRGGGDWPQSLKGYRLKHVALRQTGVFRLLPRCLLLLLLSAW